MSGKRPADEDQAQPDMEVGMTTAERRRRRRRGGSLRVPSDNVPRTRAPTAPPPPRPEDPALAMSIAYSFASDASGPVPRVRDEDDAAELSGDVVAEATPEPAAAPADVAIDASMDFDGVKTRVMSAVDLDALGLEDPSPGSSMTTMPQQRVSAPDLAPAISLVPQPPILPASSTQIPAQAAPVAPEASIIVAADVDVDVVVDTGEQTAIGEVPEPPATAAKAGDEAVAGGRARLQTVALSEEDLEEVRAIRAATQPSAPRAPQKPITKPPPLNLAAKSGEIAVPPAPVALPTQQLQAVDIEVISQAPPGSLSAPEIDLNELAEVALRSDTETAGESGEIEVDVDEAKVEADGDAQAAPSGPSVPRAQTAPVAPPLKSADAPHPPPPPPQAAKHPPAPPPQAKKVDKDKDKPKPAAPAADDKSGDKVVRGKPWFVDLFDEDYLRTLPFLTAQATQAEAEFVIDTLGLQPGAQVLDVGCGYGRHAMELAARGFHVVGLDLSTSLLLRGGEEAARRGLTINFVRGDMRELDFENQFDGAYCLFSTFGYFDDETNKKALQNIARALKPNAKVVIEILNRDYVIADLPTRVWWEGDGCVVLEEVDLNYFSSRIQVNRSVVFDDGRQLEQEISVRAYSLHEVGKLMHAAGFRVLEVSGGYQMRGRFFGNQSRHIIVLAERKDVIA